MKSRFNKIKQIKGKKFLSNDNLICFAPFLFITITGSILLCVKISTGITRNIYLYGPNGKGAVLSLWPTECAADYPYRDLGLSLYVPVQEMSLVCFLIGTISSQCDITGVIAEVMGTRWWRDGDEPLLNLLPLHLSSMWFSFCPLLILSVRLLGFILLCCRHQKVFGFSPSKWPLVSKTFAVD